MKKNIGIIYIFRNKVNGKCYIGQTIQKFKKRLEQHLYNKKDSILLYRALKKQIIKSVKFLFI